MDFRDYIKKRRKKEGLTQEEMARLAGVGLRFVRELEQGKETLRVDKVNLVLRLFGKKLGTMPLYSEIPFIDTQKLLGGFKSRLDKKRKKGG